MDILLFFFISLAITLLFARSDYDGLCLACKGLALLSTLSTVYWFILLVEHFNFTWLVATVIIIGTIYLIPEYIKAYKKGKAHREKIAKHKKEATVHHFLVRDQGPE